MTATNLPTISFGFPFPLITVWLQSCRAHHASPFGLRVAQPRGDRRTERFRRSWSAAEARTDWRGEGGLATASYGWASQVRPDGVRIEL